jgi:4-carboxymuconolactone decarboxylase
MESMQPPARTASELFSTGVEIRRAVLGDEYVERSLNSRTPLTEPLQQLVTEYCWGAVWSRPGLERKARSMIVVAMLIARGMHEELALHVRGARNNGCTDDELVEIVLQSAIYCGVPAALAAMRVVKSVLEGE